MSTNKKQTSKQVVSLASKVLSDNNSPHIQKELAASVLSQYKTQKQTGAEMEDKASKVLDSPKYSETTKTLAASALAQANKER